MTNLLTENRLRAMCHLSRWRGWTVRPYSVGEHTAIGASVMMWFKYERSAIRAWWLHDMHETEIVGDVPTPDKRMYMSDRYADDVQVFDWRVGQEAGLDAVWPLWTSTKHVDRKMLCIENDLIVTRRDDTLPAPDYNDAFQAMIRRHIMERTFADADTVVRLWHNHGMGDLG